MDIKGCQTDKSEFIVIKQFTQDGIDLVAKMAAGVWGKEQGAHSSEVARIFCQHWFFFNLVEKYDVLS